VEVNNKTWSAMGTSLMTLEKLALFLAGIEVHSDHVSSSNIFKVISPYLHNS